MRLATSSDGQVFDEPKIVPTPATVPELVAVFRVTAEELLGGEVPAALCGGVTRCHEAAKQEIAKLFSAPSFIENDTALAGLGEATAGAGQGVGVLAYLTISTGVGGVRLTNGQIDRYAVGFEPGHQIIDYHEPNKHLEDYVSGAGVKAKTGRDPRTITEPAFWEEIARLTAVGIYNTIVHWSPEMVILGGAMILGQPGIDLAVVEAELKKILTIFSEPPALKKAALADFGGLYGALAYLKSSYPRIFFAAPSF